MTRTSTMIISVLHSILFLWSALSILYVGVFAIAACLKKKGKSKLHNSKTAAQPNLCVIVPAYAEDNVILSTVEALLPQQEDGRHTIIVVSDHHTPETNQQLQALPITTLLADYSPSSKARALQLAARHIPAHTTHVVVLDADNLVDTRFLKRLCTAIQRHPDEALQCHRCAKNLDTPVARLDAISEEINNSIFRRGHNVAGISSALIGSGMCFPKEWFSTHVDSLSTSGEDKELEAMLADEGIYVRYIDSLLVYDHKVQSAGGFSGQRRRWLAAQAATLCSMLPHVPHAIANGRWAYADKCLQQALIPRSMLMVLCAVMAVLSPCLWLPLLVSLAISLYVAIPVRLRTSRMLLDLMQAPLLACIMFIGLFRLRGQNKTFAHTTH